MNIKRILLRMMYWCGLVLGCVSAPLYALGVVTSIAEANAWGLITFGALCALSVALFLGGFRGLTEMPAELR